MIKVNLLVGFVFDRIGKMINRGLILCNLVMFLLIDSWERRILEHAFLQSWESPKLFLCSLNFGAFFLSASSGENGGEIQST